MRFLQTLTMAGFLAATAVAPVAAADISGAGATFPYPIYAKWADAYKKETGIGLNYQSIGSGGGIKQIQNKTVTFGATDAPLKGDQLEKFGLIQFPMVMGGIVPVINRRGHQAGRTRPSTARRWPTSSSARSRPGTIPRSRSSIRAPSCRRSRSSSCTAPTAPERRTTSPTTCRKSARSGSRRSATTPRSSGRSASAPRATKASPTTSPRPRARSATSSMPTRMQNKLTHTKMINKDGKTVDPTSATFQAAAANAEWDSLPGYGVILANQPGEQVVADDGGNLDPHVQEAAERRRQHLPRSSSSLGRTRRATRWPTTSTTSRCRPTSSPASRRPGRPTSRMTAASRCSRTDHDPRRKAPAWRLSLRLCGMAFSGTNVPVAVLAESPLPAVVTRHPVGHYGGITL